MIILRVTMGHGWLKETVKDINTAIVFAEPAVHGQNRGVHVTTYRVETPIFGPAMPEAKSDVSVEKDVDIAGATVVSLV